MAYLVHKLASRDIGVPVLLIHLLHGDREVGQGILDGESAPYRQHNHLLGVVAADAEGSLKDLQGATTR